MYEIYADEMLFHSDVTPLESVKVTDPKLTLADSAAGSLEFVLPPGNVGYDVIKRMTTDVIVKCDDEEIWRGRVLQDAFDFWNRRKIMCEGELAFLNDSIQPPRQYLSENTSIESFFYSLIDVHNSQVGENRRFQHGMVTVTDGDQQNDNDAIYRYTNYESTLECINDKLVSRLGGHIRVRHQDGLRYLDYISDDSLGTNSQIVRFGVNLLDFSKNFDLTDLATVIVPRGERLDLDESDPRYIEGLDAYLTVESLTERRIDGKIWHDNGSMFVKNPTAIDNFGWVSAVVDWDQVTVAENLYNKAVKYLQDEQYDKMSLEIKALDLKYLQQGDAPIKMYSKLRCISEPHGMDHTFPVTRMELDLSNPDNSLYTLGTDVQLSLTQINNRVNQSILERVDTIPSKSSIVKAAQENAYQMINGMQDSYVHFITNEQGGIKRIEVTDGQTYNKEADDDSDPSTDPFPDSLNRWIWTVGGLGHIGRANYQTQWASIASMNVAMTMTGDIVADRITTGILRAINNKFELRTDNGYIKMHNGEIAGFKFDQNKDANSKFYTQEVLTKGDAIVSQYDIGCGYAGNGLVIICGNTRNDLNSRYPINYGGAPDSNRDRLYGFIQISNSGNACVCLDGIRIFGDGHVVRYDGNGNYDWDRWLSQIP